MVQDRVTFIAQEIEVEQRGGGHISMQQRAIHADGMMIEPAVLRIEMKPIKRLLHRRIGREHVIGFDETRAPDAHWHPPALIVLLRRQRRED